MCDLEGMVFKSLRAGDDLAKLAKVYVPFVDWRSTLSLLKANPVTPSPQIAQMKSPHQFRCSNLYFGGLAI